MRLIDADALEYHEIDEIGGEYNPYLGCSKEYIDRQPTIAVLDEIRAEIADLDDADYDYEGYYKAVTNAVKIIDKYRDKEQKK